MDYWELRKLISKIVPRRTQLYSSSEKVDAVKEKGRKTNYHQFNLEKKKWLKHERLLNTEEVSSFLEISLRAQACPMPLNLDIWDGLLCVAKGEKVTTTKGEIPIEEVEVGDLVLSYNESTWGVEWKPVTQTNSTEKENMVEIETEMGILLVTGDHPVFTQRGWINAEDLSLDDTLFSVEK